MQLNGFAKYFLSQTGATESYLGDSFRIYYGGEKTGTRSRSIHLEIVYSILVWICDFIFI